MNFKSPFGEIPVYDSPYIPDREIFVMYKSKYTNDGYVYVPTDIWNSGLETASSAIDEEEIIKMKKRRNPKDIHAFFCNMKNIDAEGLIKALEGYFLNNEFTD